MCEQLLFSSRPKRLGKLALAFVATAATFASHVYAQCEAFLLPLNGVEQHDYFGESVAVHGNVAVVGADHDDDMGENSGSAFVFRWDGTDWNQVAKLLAPDGFAGHYFGKSVSIASNVIAVGAPGGTPESVYIFRRHGDQWLFEAQLNAQGTDDTDFGHAVDLSEDTLVVGAPENGQRPGEAYVYTYDGREWALGAELIPSAGHAKDKFGRSVSISSDVIVVGADLDNDVDVNAGAAYVFRGGGSSWVEQAKLTASDGQSGDYFGYAVDVDDDSIVVGAYGTDDGRLKQDIGAAYIFKFEGSGWQETDKLNPSDGREGDNFGRSVSLEADTVIVGASCHNVSGFQSGAAYVFREDGDEWNAVDKLTASDGDEYDTYGDAVARSGQITIIGAWRALGDAGAAYSYLVDPVRFLSQPESAVVAVGDPICFSVEVDRGVGTMSLQWRRNGRNLTDFGTIHGSQTDTLCISDVYCADNGDYDVVITDDCNVVVSEPAVLTVDSSPILYADATCPTGGPMSIGWDCATPGGKIAVIFARNRGSVRIPDRYVCPGTQLDLGKASIQLFYLGSAGFSGQKAIYGSASPLACGGFLQLVDLSTCETSNVVQIQ